MYINWIKPGEVISPGVEEGSLTIGWIPGIPMDVLFQNPAPTEMDAEERRWLIDRADDMAALIIENPPTRRAAFHNDHKSDLPINCMNLFHFMCRNSKLNLFVYARSIHMRNLGYDLCTIDKIYNAAFRIVKEKLNVELGTIEFRIASLHYYE